MSADGTPECNLLCIGFALVEWENEIESSQFLVGRSGLKKFPQPHLTKRHLTMEDEGQADAPSPIDYHFNWPQRFVLWLLRIPIPNKHRSQSPNVFQWVLLTLGINGETQQALGVYVLALITTTVCYLAFSCAGVWMFIRLSIPSICMTVIAFCYIAAPSGHRVELFTVVSTLSTSLALMHVAIYGMSVSFCHNHIVPVNVPYAKAVEQLFFDPSYDIFNVSFMQYVGANTTINITDTISLAALNQTYCFICSISPFGKGIKIDMSEATSEEDMFQVLVARREMMAGVIEEMWKLLGIDHNKSDTYKAVRFYEQLLLPAHLYHIEMMQQAIRAVGRENQTGMGEDKVAAGKTRGSPKEGSSAEDEGGMEGEDKLGD